MRGLGSPIKQKVLNIYSTVDSDRPTDSESIKNQRQNELLSQGFIHSPNKENIGPPSPLFTKDLKGYEQDSTKRLMVLSPKFENGSTQRSPGKSNYGPAMQPINLHSPPRLKSFEKSKEDNSNDNGVHVKFESLPSLVKPSDESIVTSQMDVDEDVGSSHMDIDIDHVLSQTSGSGESTSDLPSIFTPAATNQHPTYEDIEDEEFSDAEEDNADTSFLAISQSIRKNHIPKDTGIDRYSISANNQRTSLELIETAPKESEVPKPDEQSHEPNEIENDYSSVDSSPVGRDTFGFASLPARGPLTKVSLSKIHPNSPEYLRHHSIIAQADEKLRFTSEGEASKVANSSQGLPEASLPEATVVATTQAVQEVKEITNATETTTTNSLTNASTSTSTTTTIPPSISKQPDQYPKRVESHSSIMSTISPSIFKKPLDTPSKLIKEAKAPDSGGLMSRTAGGVFRFAKQLFYDDKKAPAEQEPVEAPPQPTPSVRSDTLSRLMAPTYASRLKNISPVRVASNHSENSIPPSPLARKSVASSYPVITKPPVKTIPLPFSEKPTIQPSKPNLIQAAAPVPSESKPTPSTTTTETNRLKPIPVSNTFKPSNVKLTKQPLQPKATSQQKLTLKIPLNSKKDPTPPPSVDEATTKPVTSAPKPVISTPATTKLATSTSANPTSHRPAIGPGTSLNSKARVPAKPTIDTKTTTTASRDSTKSKLPMSSRISTSSTTTINKPPATQPRLMKRNPQIEPTKKRDSEKAFGTPLANKSSIIPPNGLKKTAAQMKTPAATAKVQPQLKNSSYSSSSMMKSTLVQQAKVAAAHHIPQAEGVKFSNDKIRFAPSATPTTASIASTIKTPLPFRQVPNTNHNVLPHSLIFTPQAHPETILPEILSESEDDDDGNILQDWANSPQLREMLLRQQQVDPDQVFGPIAPLHLDEIFRSSRISRFRPRSSSANWSGQDKLSRDEIDKYAEDMGYARN